ncbi:MAG: hypothetical protein AAF198_04065 [Pseudomonadota bacterium]
MAKSDKTEETSAQVAETNSGEKVQDMVSEDPQTVENPGLGRPSTALPDEELDTNSFASKVLTGLGLLVAGGLLALWFGPQVAPLLPSGLKPVADFLAPQADDVAEVRLDTLYEDQLDFENRVTARLQSLEQADRELETDLSELASRPRSSGTTSSSIGASDLAQLDAAIDDLRDRVAELAMRLDSGGAISETGGLQNSREDIRGLRDQLVALERQQTELATRVETVTGDFDQRLALAQNDMAEVTQAARLQVGTAQDRQLIVEIENALKSGDPFVALLDNTEITLPAAIAAVAATGTATLTDLKTAFPDLAYEAIRADLSPGPDATAGQRLASVFRQQVATRSLEPIEGGSTDAILSRMEAALTGDDLDLVLVEAAGLTAKPTQVMDAWLSDIRARQGAFEALKTVALTSAEN